MTPFSTGSVFVVSRSVVGVLPDRWSHFVVCLALLAITGGCVEQTASRQPVSSVSNAATPTPKSSATAAPVVANQVSTRDGDSETNSPPPTKKRFTTEYLNGRVVLLAEAIAEQLSIHVVPDARERVLALQTDTGELLPIIEDLRGRSFRTDQRLRDMHVQLHVRRYEQTPMLQVLRIYELDGKEKQIVDYWCDVCAIVMFEDGPCDCCQDHNRLRKRPAQ